MQKKVLIITYYWPPSAGVGVQRWLKFSRFLPEFDWTPVILTPENPQFTVNDNTLQHTVSGNIEVLRLPIWEPFDLFRKIMGKKSEGMVKQGLVLESEGKSVLNQTVIWVRGNLFLPDPRVFWKNNVIRFLEEHLKTNHYDLLVTTGPPHSMHLIGLEIQRKFQIRWVADFRDPWSRWDMLKELQTGKLAMRWHLSAEQKVLSSAEAVICTSDDQGKMFASLGAKRVEVITNGFDEDDISELNHPSAAHEYFEMIHLGLLNELRNPVTLWAVLEELLTTNKNFASRFRLTLGGITGNAVERSIAQFPELCSRTTFIGYLPHREMLQRCTQASLLLIVQNQSTSAPLIIPAKLFEYLAVKRPILQIGPENCHAARILKEASAGITVDHQNPVRMKDEILKFFEGRNQTTPDEHYISQFSRKQLTGRLSTFFNEICRL